MIKRPRILLTNDDGIDAPGIKTVYESLAKHADLIVVAPQTNLSSVGVSVSLKTPLSIHRATWENGAVVWKVNGTPVDCVRLGLHKLVDHKPDLIVSGINQGSNAGRTILYSGTVGAVIDGVIQGIPAVALSVAQFFDINYEKLKEHIWPIIEFALQNPMPAGTLLNVNFPSTEMEYRGVSVAKQGQGYWGDNLEEREHPEGFSYFWMGGRRVHHDEDEMSDVALLENGYTTLVPIQIADLTNHALCKSLQDKIQEHFKAVTH